jgi:uncharacterized repeat protein (TIGR03803 family)
MPTEPAFFLSVLMACCAAAAAFAPLHGTQGQQTYKVLYSFQGNPDGEGPVAELLPDSAGNLYGTTPGGGEGGTIFKLSPDGSESILYSFGAGGSVPLAGLIADANGNLYGTAFSGGKKCGTGCGVVYKLAPDKTETVLHLFTGKQDGKFPRGRLVFDGVGNLYGTTSEGGGGCPPNRDGCGTVFKIAPDGTETILHAFKGGSDGSAPSGALILDNAGNLYGTTNTTVFRLTQDGTETVLHSFTGGVTDGLGPTGSLVSDSDGNLFGVTDGGGTGCNGSGCGTIFKITPQGEESIVYSFQGGNDGSEPMAGLFRAANGNLCGTTARGGGSGCQANAGCGTVFFVTPDGVETILHAFAEKKDGRAPLAALVPWRHGYVVGTTSAGGTHRRVAGTVFEVLLQE